MMIFERLICASIIQYYSSNCILMSLGSWLCSNFFFFFIICICFLLNMFKFILFFQLKSICLNKHLLLKPCMHKLNYVLKTIDDIHISIIVFSKELNYYYYLFYIAIRGNTYQMQILNYDFGCINKIMLMFYFKPQTFFKNKSNEQVYFTTKKCNTSYPIHLGSIPH
jgi:hypothetical protein